MKDKLNLLSLPLELREEIYKQLLFSPYTPFSPDVERISIKKKTHWFCVGPDPNFYEILLPGRPSPGTQMFAASPLLGASRTTRREICAMITRLQEDLPWRLEMDVPNKLTLDAKWTHLPVPPSLYTPHALSFANSKRDLPLRSKTSAHNIVATLRIPPALDEELNWIKYRRCSKLIANLLAVTGSWCAHGVGLSHRQWPIPFINTLTVLLRPPHPEYLVTDAELSKFMDRAFIGNIAAEHRLLMQRSHQSRHLAGLVFEVQEFAGNGLLYGFFKTIKIGVERLAVDADMETTSCDIPCNDSNDRQDKDILFGSDQRVWDPKIDGEKKEIVEVVTVVDKPLKEKQMTAYAWSNFGWMARTFRCKRGAIQGTWLPYGLTTVWDRETNSGFGAERWQSLKHLTLQ